MHNRKRIAIRLFATLLGLVSAVSTCVHSQERCFESRPERDAEEKTKSAKPANSATDAANPAPATSPGKNTAKDSSKAAKTALGKDMMWVNTATGIYHKKGTRYYGKTKEGKYMPEDGAVQAGYVPRVIDIRR